MTQHRNIDDYLSLDEDDLFEELGAQLLGGGLGAAPGDPDQHEQYGRQWFESRLGQIRDRVCGDRGIETIRTGERGDPLMLVATVSDSVASLSGRPAAAVLAVIVLRLGLDTLCAGR